MLRFTSKCRKKTFVTTISNLPFVYRRHKVSWKINGTTASKIWSVFERILDFSGLLKIIVSCRARRSWRRRGRGTTTNKQRMYVFHGVKWGFFSHQSRRPSSLNIQKRRENRQIWRIISNSNHRENGVPCIYISCVSSLHIYSDLRVSGYL